MMLGPLVGYGFLAGATVDLPDDFATPRRGWRRLLARRSVWVAAGPWCGFIALGLLFLAFGILAKLMPPLPMSDLPQWWQRFVVRDGSPVGFHGAVCCNHRLCLALACVGRASAGGISSVDSIARFIVAWPWRCAFVGSLFGSFWAATSWWRSHFFDSRCTHVDRRVQP